MLLSHCCFQPLTQPYDPWLLLRTGRRTIFVLPHSKGSFLWTLQHYIWSNTTEVIDFLCLSVIPFVTRPTALLSSLMVETPALKETLRKTQRGDHFWNVELFLSAPLRFFAVRFWQWAALKKLLSLSFSKSNTLIWQIRIHRLFFPIFCRMPAYPTCGYGLSLIMFRSSTML